MRYAFIIQAIRTQFKSPHAFQKTEWNKRFSGEVEMDLRMVGYLGKLNEEELPEKLRSARAPGLFSDETASLLSFA